jgi:hypothetical protein
MGWKDAPTCQKSVVLNLWPSVKTGGCSRSREAAALLMSLRSATNHLSPLTNHLSPLSFPPPPSHLSPLRRANACLYRACRDAQGRLLTSLSDIWSAVALAKEEALATSDHGRASGPQGQSMRVTAVFSEFMIKQWPDTYACLLLGQSLGFNQPQRKRLTLTSREPGGHDGYHLGRNRNLEGFGDMG